MSNVFGSDANIIRICTHCFVNSHRSMHEDWANKCFGCQLEKIAMLSVLTNNPTHTVKGPPSSLSNDKINCCVLVKITNVFVEAQKHLDLLVEQVSQQQMGDSSLRFIQGTAVLRNFFYLGFICSCSGLQCYLPLPLVNLPL